MDVMQEYTRWLTMFAQDEKLVAELESIREYPKEIEDRFYTELSFGTAGMRGVLGYGLNRMNIYNIRRATAGFAEYLKQTPEDVKRGVAVGYDSRIMSDVFARETALVLAARGIKTFLFDALRPVPVVSYAIRHLNCPAASMMVGWAWNLRLAFLKGSVMRFTESMMDRLSSRLISTLLVSPINPMMVVYSPWEICTSSPMVLNHWHRLSRCSVVVPCFNIAIIVFSFRFQQKAAQFVVLCGWEYVLLRYALLAAQTTFTSK